MCVVLADLLDDLQTRFGASGAEEAGQAKAEMTSATPCQAWGWLLARLRFRVAVAAEDWALARLSLQTFTALATEPEQVIHVTPRPSTRLTAVYHHWTSRVLCAKPVPVCNMHERSASQACGYTTVCHTRTHSDMPCKAASPMLRATSR